MGFAFPPLRNCFVRMQQKHSRFDWYLQYQQSGCFASLLTAHTQLGRLKRPPDSKPCNGFPLSFFPSSFPLSLMAFSKEKRPFPSFIWSRARKRCCCVVVWFFFSFFSSSSPCSNSPSATYFSSQQHPPCNRDGYHQEPAPRKDEGYLNRFQGI